jgi:uncharacterized membrane protein YqaE (UPF0057 family)
MKVAYIFATQRHTVSYVLGKMILPQLEEGRHGVWLNIVLTLMGYFPGLVHAIWVIARK